MRFFRIFLLALLVGAQALPAWADRGETYALLSFEPGVAAYSDPSLGRATSTQFGGGFGPRWTSENRPTMDGSKPANGQDPGPVRF